MWEFRGDRRNSEPNLLRNFEATLEPRDDWLTFLHYDKRCKLRIEDFPSNENTFLYIYIQLLTPLTTYTDGQVTGLWNRQPSLWVHGSEAWPELNSYAYVLAINKHLLHKHCIYLSNANNYNIQLQKSHTSYIEIQPDWIDSCPVNLSINSPSN